jgi:single-strand DNA-binding protein
MASVNKVELLGNLGGDPILRYTPQGTAVANFNMATNDRWTNKGGEKQERVEWHRIVVWGKQGENCAEYLSKGRQVYVAGRLQTRKWTDSEKVDRYTTEIIALNVQFLGNGKGGVPHSADTEEQTPPLDEEPISIPEDDIPF